MASRIDLSPCAVRVAKPSWGVWSILGAFMAALFLAAGAFAQGLVLFQIACVAFGVLLGVSAWRGRASRMEARRFREGARVEIDEQGLRVSGERLLRYGEVSAGLVQPSESGATARLHHRTTPGFVEIDTPTIEGARAIVEAFGVGAREKAATIAVNGTSRLGALVWTPLLGLLLVGNAARVHPMLAMMSLAVMVGIWVALAVPVLRRPHHVEIGVDAIVLDSTIGGRKVIPLRSVRSVEVDASEMLVVALEDGAKVASKLDAHEGALVVERIREAIAASDAAPRASAETKMLARAGRSVRDWMSTLHALLDKPSDAYRGGIDALSLLAVVEDPRAPSEERAAAAVALRPKLDDETRMRIRVAAETTAAPRLRVALDAVTSDADEETIVRALDELR